MCWLALQDCGGGDAVGGVPTYIYLSHTTFLGDGLAVGGVCGRLLPLACTKDPA